MWSLHIIFERGHNESSGVTHDILLGGQIKFCLGLLGCITPGISANASSYSPTASRTLSIIPSICVSPTSQVLCTIYSSRNLCLCFRPTSALWSRFTKSPTAPLRTPALYDLYFEIRIQMQQGMLCSLSRLPCDWMLLWPSVVVAARCSSCIRLIREVSDICIPID